MVIWVYLRRKRLDDEMAARGQVIKEFDAAKLALFEHSRQNVIDSHRISRRTKRLGGQMDTTEEVTSPRSQVHPDEMDSELGFVSSRGSLSGSVSELLRRQISWSSVLQNDHEYRAVGRHLRTLLVVSILALTGRYGICATRCLDLTGRQKKDSQTEARQAT